MVLVISILLVSLPFQSRHHTPAIILGFDPGKVVQTKNDLDPTMIHLILPLSVLKVEYDIDGKSVCTTITSRDVGVTTILA